MSRPASVSTAKSAPAAKPTATAAAPAPISTPSASTSTPPPEKETKINLEELYSQHPIQYAIRSKHGVNFRHGPLSTIQPETNVEYKSCDDAGLIYSSDGSLVALIDKDVVDIYETKEYKKIQQIPRPAVGHAYFSSHHTYLITWERRSERRAQGATQPEQLRVWRISDGTCIFMSHQKDLTPESWPLQWSHDERIMLHIVSNEIRCYEVPEDGNIPIKWNFTHKLHVQGVTSFAIAPVVVPYLIAVFVPAKGTDPARVHIYRYPKLDADAHIASKSFYKAEEVSLKWSPLGHALLIEASTSTDKTGKSYYGESNLHLLHADGSFQCTVPFGTNAGPIQDVAWSPAGKEFLVIQGFQPAKSLLFLASNCTPIRDFGTASRNTIRWSPHGRFVCIAGFGNLAGEMDFWDNNKFKKLGSCQDRNGAKSYEWTPDSRNFITAVLRPWRRVDNGYKIWTYYGEIIYQENYDELYQVVPQPSLPTIYPNRPMSPRLKSREVVEAKKETETKPSAYVPPHLRGTGKTCTIMAREVTSGPRKLTQLEQSLLRDPNAKPIATATPQLSRDEYRKQKKKEQRKKKAEAAHEEPEPEPEPEAKAEVPEVSTESLSKNPKVIQKKLKQIESLKEQLASGQSLDTQALAKIAQEDILRKHLEALTLEATTI